MPIALYGEVHLEYFRKPWRVLCVYLDAEQDKECADF